MSKPALTSRFFVGESDSESEAEPLPSSPPPPRLTPQQKKKLERQMRFDQQQEEQKEAQAAEAAQRQEANKQRRDRKARNQQNQQPSSGGGGQGFSCRPESFVHLATLGLKPSQNTQEDIKRAYRALCLLHHPDKGGDPEICKRINAAHDYLMEEA